MRVFISGGCKNGKSTYAQKIAEAQRKEEKSLYYIATMHPVDEEDEERIARHVLERSGRGYETVEVPAHILEILNQCDERGSFLLDSLTALLANEMFGLEGTQREIHKKIGKEIKQILDKIEDIVIVSDYIYADLGMFEDDTQSYQKSLAYLDRLCARECDLVLEICFGNVIVHKGKFDLEAVKKCTDGSFYETLV